MGRKDQQVLDGLEGEFLSEPKKKQMDLDDVFTNSRPDGVVPVARIRVRGTVRVIDSCWVEVHLQLRISNDRPWLPITPEDAPLLVARRFSGSDKKGEVQELYVIAALKRELSANGAEVSLMGSESRLGRGSTEWRYWAQLSSRLSVAVRLRQDGTVEVLGLT